MRDRNQIDSLFSIFVLDFCFIMPTFLFVGLGLIWQRGWAMLLVPAMFVLGSVLMVSLIIAEFAKPIFGQQFTVPGVLPPLVLAALCAVLAAVHLHRLRLRTEPDRGSSAPQPISLVGRSLRTPQ
jgi:hypothetical protein